VHRKLTHALSWHFLCQPTKSSIMKRCFPDDKSVNMGFCASGLIAMLVTDDLHWHVYCGAKLWCVHSAPYTLVCKWLCCDSELSVRVCTMQSQSTALPVVLSQQLSVPCVNIMFLQTTVLQKQFQRYTFSNSKINKSPLSASRTHMLWGRQK
jgi:hypothetical protein